MKRYRFILFLLLSPFMASTQVTDQASFTASLDEILYINVTSGATINFVFNRIDQLKNGISNAAQYNTNFTVNSTSNYEVEIYAESLNLIGADNPANVIPVTNIGYNATYTGAIGGRFSLPAALTPLTNVNAKVVTKLLDNYEQNAQFQIQWECATAALGGPTLLSQNKRNDHYTTNVMLEIIAVP